MLRRLQGFFSSSLPQSSGIKTEDGNSDANHDSDAEMENVGSVNGFQGNADLNDEERARKFKEERKRAKSLRRKERKRRKRDALDSSVLGSSVLDSSVLGEDVEARGMEAEGREPALQLVTSPPTLSNGLNGNADEEKVAEEPIPEKSRKSTRASKKQMKVEAVETNNFVESQIPAEPEYEQESQDMVAVLRKERLAKSKETKDKKSKKSSLAVEASPPAEEDEDAALRLREQDDSLSQLPGKIEKAKQKVRRSTRELLQAQENLEDDNDSAAPLHQRLTPAHNTRSRSRSVAPEDITEAKAQIQRKAASLARPAARPDTIEEDKGEPEQPSKKALGKRRASDTIVESNSKRRKSKDKAAGTAKLTEHGFVSSQVAPSAKNASKPRSRSRSRSVSHHSLEELGQTAARLWASQMENERTSLPAEEVPPASSNVLTSSQQRRTTPMFTPINRRKPTAATVDPIENDPYVLPPSSQPQPESSLESPVKEPKSSGRQKRRLPIGEPELSEVKRKEKTPKRKSSISKTPKPRASKLPTSSQITPVSKGARLPEDDIEAIYNAVEEYRDQHDLEQEQLNAMIQADASKDENKAFWKYMYEEITTVPRAKILNQCRRKFHNFEARGSWTAEQDQDLKDAHERNPGKWKQIGAELNRFAEDCRDRWRNYLVCGDNQRKDAWDKEEEEKLKEVVEECVELIREIKRKGKSKNQSDLTNDDYSLLDWQIVSTKMDRTRSRLQCISKWKQIREREDAEDEDPVADRPISTTEWRLEEAERVARRLKAPEKLQILYQIRDSKAGREGTIPWKQIQEELGVKGKKMALRVCYRSLKEHIPDSEDMKLQDTVSALIDLYEASAPKEPHGFEKFVSPARHPKSANRKSGIEDDDADEESEELLTISKKRRKSNTKKDEGNGEGPSTQKARQSKGRKAAMMHEMEHDNQPSPVQKKSPKKLRSRMKIQAQLDSQETNAESVEFDDDISAAFEAVKTTPSKSPKAKKPLTKPKRSKRLSEYRVVESEDEAEQEQMVVVDPTQKPNRVPSSEHNVRLEHDEKPDEEVQQEQNEDEDIQIDEQRRQYRNITANEQEVPESGHFTSSYDQHRPPNNGYLDSEDEEEDYTLNTHDQESIDLDEPHHITTNGFNISDDSLDDMEDESVDQDSLKGIEGSVDLDDPAPMKRRQEPIIYSSSEDEKLVDENGVNGIHGFARGSSVSVSSDASTILAKARSQEEVRERLESAEL